MNKTASPASPERGQSCPPVHPSPSLPGARTILSAGTTITSTRQRGQSCPPHTSPGCSPAVRHAALASTIALFLFLLTAHAAATDSLPPTPTNTLTGDTLFFRNGDQFTGRLGAIDPQAGLRWSHPDAAGPVTFNLASIAEVELGRRPQSAANSVVNCRLHLHGDAELEGTLVGFEADQLTVETWFAGRLSLPRARLRVLQTVSPKAPPLFEGPSGFEGWTVGKVQAQLTESGEWKYRQGAFYARNAAAIARDVHLPDLSIIEFDLAWQGTFHLAVALYTDSLQPITLANKDNEPDFGGFYSLQLNSYSADLLPVKRNEPLRYMGQVTVPAFGQKSAAHIEIRTDKRRRIVALMVDGAVVRQWMDTTEFAGRGTAIRFVNQGRGGLKISRVRVAEWDGRFEERPTTNPGQKQDQAWLRSGDRLNGTLLAIRDDRLVFSTNPTTAPIELPLAQLRQLEFKSINPTPEPPADSARAHLREGGVLNVKIERWDDQGIVVTDAAAGRITLNPAALHRIQFPPISGATR